MKVLVQFFGLVAVLGGTLAMAQQGAADPKAASAGEGKPAAQASAKPAEGTITADPAIWRVKGKHGTVYLFGSVHVMKPNVDWESAKVKAAMGSSDVVYLEIANMDDAAVAQPLALKYGVDPAHPLSTKISKEDLATLDTAAKSMGLPGEAMFEPMQPWLVSTALQMVPMLKAGYAPSSGIDMKVLAESKGKQKTVKGFETLEDQVHMLADSPQEQQVEMLHKELTELE